MRAKLKGPECSGEHIGPARVYGKAANLVLHFIFSISKIKDMEGDKEDGEIAKEREKKRE